MTIPFVLFLIIQFGMLSPAWGFSTERAGFSVKIGKEIIPYRLMSLFVMPNEVVTVEVIEGNRDWNYRLESSEGTVIERGRGRWKWQAPEMYGVYRLWISGDMTGSGMILNVVVLLPYSELDGEYLNGYRMGRYPDVAYKKLPIYEPPKGFVEVTEENADLLVSPHFRLGQFLCKQENEFPKYLVLRSSLLLKLELILEEVNEQGYACETFHVMSGYRTPYYNEAIGNVRYSRHLWGGAADIFIDEDPEDGMMDDLNRDGSIDYHDAEILYDIIDRMVVRRWYEILMGGLGWYPKTKNHGPFVHVDVRGFRARWAD